MILNHFIEQLKMGSSVLKFGSRKLNRENWSVFHPNGSHMYTCGENKVKWYLSRGLASVSGDKEITTMCGNWC